MDSTAKIPREREAGPCPCGSGHSYDTCCMLYHYGRSHPETAEQLMRSRYSAYFFRLCDYLVDTTHPDTRTRDLKRDYESNIHDLNWHGLEILGNSKGGSQDKVGKVEFVARCVAGGEQQELHECSRFRRFKGRWKYLDNRG